MQEQRRQILVKGEDKTDQIRVWRQSGDKVDITYTNGKTYSYNAGNIRFIDSALVDANAGTCFEYLSCLAKSVGLKDDAGNNILARRYEKIDFISQDSMLTAFLTGRLNLSAVRFLGDTIFPFGFNISQMRAVNNALSSPLSIIEGPPGTGKTQTILNIIANAVIHGESVAVVSNSNSATSNVLEKLGKYDVEFIAAYLGNTDNKRSFIDSQKPLPDLSKWVLDSKRSKFVHESLRILALQLRDMLEKKNKLSRLKQESDNLTVEFKHFDEYYRDNITVAAQFSFKKHLNAALLLELWILFEGYAEKKRAPGFLRRIYNRFKYGITDKSMYEVPIQEMITELQKRYYETRINELNSEISMIEKQLEIFDFDSKMKEYSDLSSEIFKDKLAAKYGKLKRERFELDDLWKNSEQFIKAYPVILSTTYSLRSSLSHKAMYDYVIIDESSQVDLATGALVLSCARKAVVVGDLKQLSNVVDNKTSILTDSIFSQFNLPEAYRYKNHSLLSAFVELFPNAPRVLLREHYRCHPKIIEFCNQKFYNGELIVLTEPKSNRQPLLIYQTVEGNHARDHINQRQIDVIKREVIPEQSLNLESASIGIVTPYRNQTNALQNAFAGTAVKADTVDKFQGRENDVIILSTVDNEISDFTDNANRLNVAVSRAIEQLIVVVSAADTERDTNFGDLIRYIRYNNMEVVRSSLYSVFDYLYNSYAEKRTILLAKHGRISEYDSENLMFILIKDVLRDSRFNGAYGVTSHIPLKMIIRDFDKLDDAEVQYVMNPLTHVDFLIFDKFGKTPRLIIEVDGVSYHREGTRQAERDSLKNKILGKYDLPFIRFKTNGSGEREQLIAMLST